MAVRIRREMVDSKDMKRIAATLVLATALLTGCGAAHHAPTHQAPAASVQIGTALSCTQSADGTAISCTQ